MISFLSDKALATKQTYDWKRRKILVVEDDESSSFLINEILKHTGVDIAYTSDGNEAVDYIKSNPNTDLILMDIHLPVKDGFAATKEIKNIKKKIVVIAQTAYAFSSDRDKAREAGCDDFITKPLNPYLLLSKLNTYL